MVILVFVLPSTSFVSRRRMMRQWLAFRFVDMACHPGTDNDGGLTRVCTAFGKTGHLDFRGTRHVHRAMGQFLLVDELQDGKSIARSRGFELSVFVLPML